jgi:hypothetical protein
MSKNTAVSKKEETALSTAADNAVALTDIAEFSGAGFENATVDSFAIPFLQLLQSGSPQCKRSDGAFIEGASEGMLLDTVTNEVIDVFKKPVRLVAVFYKEAKVEWKIRENGGGFVAEHPVTYAERTQRDEKNRDILPNGNQLVDTATFYVLRLKDDGVPAPMVLTMTSTQRKKAKKFLTGLNAPLRYNDQLVARPPMFLRVWDFWTKAESNDKGSWFGWEFKEVGTADAATFKMAKDFFAAVKGGRVKEATDTLKPATAEEGSAGEAGNAAF